MHNRPHYLLLTFIVILALLGSPFLVPAHGSPADSLFDPATIVEVDIVMDPADWDFIRVQTRDEAMELGPVCREHPFPSPFVYREATVSVNGRILERVGVRKKGFIGSVFDFGKPSLKIDFEEFVDDQELYGLEKLTLNNNSGDPSMLCQYLTYLLVRSSGLAAPRCNFARVTVNGDYIGLYSNVETVNKRFLAENFADNTGNLWEGTGSDFRDEFTGTFELDGGSGEPDPSRLFALSAALELSGASLVDAVSSLVDLDQFLRFWGLEILSTHGDGYASDINNYFVYENPATERMEFIHHGVDKAMFWLPNQQSIYSAAKLPHELYKEPEVRQRLAAAMQDLLDGHFDEDELIAEIDAMEARIAPHVEWNRYWGRTHAGWVNDSRKFVRQRPAAVQAMIDDMPSGPQDLYPPCRYTFTPPGPLAINEICAINDSVVADQDGEFDDWIELRNNTDNAVDLSGFHLSDTFGDLQKWTFPGGTVIPAQGHLVVWADNDLEQEGLHANFKVSGSGAEEIYLVSPGGQVVDSRGLWLQQTDVTFGRLPDGTGDFDHLVPTFSGTNGARACDLDLTLSDYPPSVAPGQVVVFVARADNSCDISRGFDEVTMTVNGPVNTERPLYSGPIRSVAAGAALESTVRLPVPGITPTGTYEVGIELLRNGTRLDEESFVIQVAP